MGDRAILEVVPTSWNEVHKLLDSLLPGDRMDLDDIPEKWKIQFLDEFDGRNYKLSSSGKVGMVETCPACDGHGQDAQCRTCLRCEGTCLLIDEGHGLVPFHG